MSFDANSHQVTFFDDYTTGLHRKTDMQIVAQRLDDLQNAHNRLVNEIHNPLNDINPIKMQLHSHQNQIDQLFSDLSRVVTYTNLSTLVMIGKMTNEDVKTILNMLKSPDPENWQIAKSLYKQKMEESNEDLATLEAIEDTSTDSEINVNGDFAI